MTLGLFSSCVAARPRPTVGPNCFSLTGVRAILRRDGELANYTPLGPPLPQHNPSRWPATKPATPVTSDARAGRPPQPSWRILWRIMRSGM